MFTDYMQMANDSADELKKVKVTDGMVKKAGITNGLLGAGVQGNTAAQQLEPPKHWTQKALEEDGGMKFFGKMLLGGLTGLTPLLFPEMIGSKARYASELETYGDQLLAQNMADKIGGIDFDNLRPEDIATLNAASKDLGKYGTDRLAAQMNSGGGDAAIAESFGYKPYQWAQLSPEQKRDYRDEYRYKNGGSEAFRYRQAAEGKTPEQMRAAKSSELFGSAQGQQYGDDRAIITGVRGQVQSYDQGLESLGSIKTMLEDPENSDTTGWPRIIRDAINTNTKEDGSMDAEMAAGVVELISQATFGALSQSELDLLKGGLMDPTKSTEYNLGTINTAMKRIENDRELAIESAKGAAGRYSKWEGQKDYDTLMENEWLYNNVGEGSRIQSIPAYGGRDEITFQDYAEYAKSQRGPFDEPPSRDELITGFAEMRKQAEAEYKAMIEKKNADREAAERARLGLDRPWPTVAGQE